jgi:hypothetical protein
MGRIFFFLSKILTFSFVFKKKNSLLIKERRSAKSHYPTEKLLNTDLGLSMFLVCLKSSIIVLVRTSGWSIQRQTLHKYFCTFVYFVLLLCEFSPILILLFRHSIKCDGLQKFAIEIQSYLFIFVQFLNRTTKPSNFTIISPHSILWVFANKHHFFHQINRWIIC